MQVPDELEKSGQPPTPSPLKLVIDGASQKCKYAQVRELQYLGGLVTELGDYTHEVNSRRRAAWECLG